MKQHFGAHGIPSKLLMKNGPQFAKREFKSFASEWSFKHVSGSLYFPHFNGFAENAVKQAKSLLEKCKRDGSDPFLGLLKLRNVPRDQVLGSPAQRLMLRHARCVLPVARKLLTPQALNTKSHITISMLNLSFLSIHSKSCHFRLTEGTKKYALSSNLLCSHGRTLWKLKESSTVK